MRRGWEGQAIHGSDSSSLGMERVLVFSLGLLKREIRMAVSPATVKVQVLGLCPLPPTRFGGSDVVLILASRRMGCWSLAPCGGLVWTSSETHEKRLIAAGRGKSVLARMVTM